VSRYREDPGAAVRTWAGDFYVVLTTGASVGAFALILVNNWFAQNRWTQILIAGGGAMAFFRTSLSYASGTATLPSVPAASSRSSLPPPTAMSIAGVPPPAPTPSRRS
jgi:hypothetical protein